MTPLMKKGGNLITVITKILNLGMEGCRSQICKDLLKGREVLKVFSLIQFLSCQK